MLNAVFVTMALLTLSPTPTPTPRPPSPSGKPGVRASAHAQTAVGPHVWAGVQAPFVPPGGVADPNGLYSIRARKRFAAYLRLRLLELREEHLTRAADAIERHISISDLLQNP